MPDTPPDYYDIAEDQQDPTMRDIAKRRLAGREGEVSALDTAAANAQAGIAGVNTAEQGALGRLREQSGRAFAAQNAQGGGGSLAGMRQNALSRGVAEGQVSGDFAMQKIAAQRLADQTALEAQKGHSELADTQKKALEEAQNYVNAGTSAYDKAKQDFLKFADNTWFYTSDAQMDQFVKGNADLQAALHSQNPHVRAKAEQFVKDMKAGVFSEEED